MDKTQSERWERFQAACRELERLLRECGHAPEHDTEFIRATDDLERIFRRANGMEPSEEIGP